MDRTTFSSVLKALVFLFVIAGAAYAVKILLTPATPSRITKVPSIVQHTPMMGLDPSALIMPSPIPTMVLTDVPPVRTPTPGPRRNTPTPTRTSESQRSTGALMVAPPQSVIDQYAALYTLLKHPPVFEESFMIIPIKKERQIEIYIASPFDTNILAADAWLDSQGFGNLPAKNVIYYGLE